MIGLSPMDGVTDPAFRFMVDSYGSPDIIFTEFVSAEGVSAGAIKLLELFKSHETKTPIIGQIFGTEPEAFYKSTFVLLEMGLDGVDINMGCPDKNITTRGAGAALIKNTELAKKIVFSVKRAVREWVDGKEVDKVGLRQKTLSWLSNYKNLNTWVKNKKKRLVPVSIKTRTGYDKPVTKSWIEHLAELEPDMITLHGRTLKQMYTGLADWVEIAIAKDCLKDTNIKFFGNGDIKSLIEAKKRVAEYSLDGVLVGRACFGNPWFFSSSMELDGKARLKAMKDHCDAFIKLTPEGNFLSLRKHFAWYSKGLPEGAKLREKLVRVCDREQLDNVINRYLDKFANI